MTVVITQPTYLPWLGYFELIARADAFVFLDTVQFEKQSWQSRNRIRSRKGDIQWLSAPIKAAPLETSIQHTEISPTPHNWRRKQLRTITESLSKAPHFDSDATPLLNDHFQSETPPNNLADTNINFITRTAKALRLHTTFHRASDLNSKGHREDLLIHIIKQLGGDHYYSNAGSAVYLDEAKPKFQSENITLEYQAWNHPTYPQNCEPFQSHLSCLDAIASIGLDACHKHLKAHA